MEISPLGLQRQTGPWTSKKKWKLGVLINNRSFVPAAKMTITKFQGSFSYRLQDSYPKVHDHDTVATEQGISMLPRALEGQ